MASIIVLVLGVTAAGIGAILNHLPMTLFGLGIAFLQFYIVPYIESEEEHDESHR